MTDKKSRRTRLNIQQKLEALRMIEGGYKNSAIMQKFDIAERTVLKLKKDGPQIIKDAERNSLTLNTKSVRPAKFPAVDDEILRFIELARSAKYPITLDAIMQRALLVKESILKHSILEEKERTRLQAFTASKGWVLNFIRRHGLRSVALRGQDASINVAAEKNELTELRQRLVSFDARHVFNVDETALFFNVLPRDSYVSIKFGKGTLVDSEFMDVNHRITAYLCSNADGSERAPVAIIGKTKNPKCFKNGRIPQGMAYYSNKTACANGPTLRRWFNGVFLPFIRSRTDQKVALLVDYASLHGDLKDGRGQVEVIALPPNITTSHQPMDLGVIVKWKIEYRKRMLAAICVDIGTRTERRFLNEANMPGFNGVAEGYEPHMLDVMKWTKDAWDFIPKELLVKCWRNAGILPDSLLSGVKEGEGEDIVVHDNEVKEVKEMIDKLKRELKIEDPLREHVQVDLNENIIKRWLNVENDEEIRNAMIADALDEMKSPQPKINVPAEHEVVEESSSEEELEMLPMEMPTLKMLYEAFRPAQHLAVKCNLPDATQCIKLAITCIRNAIAKANNNKRRREEAGDSKTKKRTPTRKRAKKDNLGMFDTPPHAGVKKNPIPRLPEKVTYKGPSWGTDEMSSLAHTSPGTQLAAEALGMMNSIGPPNLLLAAGANEIMRGSGAAGGILSAPVNVNQPVVNNSAVVAGLKQPELTMGIGNTSSTPANLKQSDLALGIMKTSTALPIKQPDLAMGVVNTTSAPANKKQPDVTLGIVNTSSTPGNLKQSDVALGIMKTSSALASLKQPDMATVIVNTSSTPANRMQPDLSMGRLNAPVTSANMKQPDLAQGIVNTSSTPANVKQPNLDIVNNSSSVANTKQLDSTKGLLGGIDSAKGTANVQQPDKVNGSKDMTAAGLLNAKVSDGSEKQSSTVKSVKEITLFAGVSDGMLKSTTVVPANAKQLFTSSNNAKQT